MTPWARSAVNLANGNVDDVEDASSDVHHGRRHGRVDVHATTPSSERAVRVCGRRTSRTCRTTVRDQRACSSRCLCAPSRRSTSTGGTPSPRSQPALPKDWFVGALGRLLPSAGDRHLPVRRCARRPAAKVWVNGNVGVRQQGRCSDVNWALMVDGPVTVIALTAGQRVPIKVELCRGHRRPAGPASVRAAPPRRRQGGAAADHPRRRGCTTSGSAGVADRAGTLSTPTSTGERRAPTPRPQVTEPERSCCTDSHRLRSTRGPRPAPVATPRPHGEDGRSSGSTPPAGSRCTEGSATSSPSTPTASSSLRANGRGHVASRPRNAEQLQRHSRPGSSADQGPGLADGSHKLFYNRPGDDCYGGRTRRHRAADPLAAVADAVPHPVLGRQPDQAVRTTAAASSGSRTLVRSSRTSASPPTVCSTGCGTPCAIDWVAQDPATRNNDGDASTVVHYVDHLATKPGAITCRSTSPKASADVNRARARVPVRPGQPSRPIVDIDGVNPAAGYSTKVTYDDAVPPAVHDGRARQGDVADVERQGPAAHLH